MRGIYLRTDPNGIHYIGLSCDIYRRWKEEDREAMKPTRTHTDDLYFALKYYGINNFKNKVLEEIPYDDTKDIHENVKILSDRERYWIEKYDSYNKGYNKTRGGSGVALSQAEQRKIFEERKPEILQAIEDGITQDLFTDEFKINHAYYGILRERSNSKPNRFKYLDKHNKLNKGQRIWYNKKKNRPKKCNTVKEKQKGVIQWVEIDKAVYNLSRACGGRNKKNTFSHFEHKRGIMIENKIFCSDGGYIYVNAKGTHIKNKIPFEQKPEWATEYMMEQANKFLNKNK